MKTEEIYGLQGTISSLKGWSKEVRELIDNDKVPGLNFHFYRKDNGHDLLNYDFINEKDQCEEFINKYPTLKDEVKEAIEKNIIEINMYEEKYNISSINPQAYQLMEAIQNNLILMHKELVIENKKERDLEDTKRMVNVMHENNNITTIKEQFISLQEQFIKGDIDENRITQELFGAKRANLPTPEINYMDKIEKDPKMVRFMWLEDFTYENEKEMDAGKDLQLIFDKKHNIGVAYFHKTGNEHMKSDLFKVVQYDKDLNCAYDSKNLSEEEKAIIERNKAVKNMYDRLENTLSNIKREIRLPQIQEERLKLALEFIQYEQKMIDVEEVKNHTIYSKEEIESKMSQAILRSFDKVKHHFPDRVLKAIKQEFQPEKERKSLKELLADAQKEKINRQVAGRDKTSQHDRTTFNMML